MDAKPNFRCVHPNKYYQARNGFTIYVGAVHHYKRGQLGEPYDAAIGWYRDDDDTLHLWAAHLNGRVSVDPQRESGLDAVQEIRA